MEAKEVKNNNYTIICFSDIHGNKEALKACLEEFDADDTGIIWN